MRDRRSSLPRADRPVASPRIPDGILAANPRSTGVPAPHTVPEIAALVGLLLSCGASSIAIGHGRHTTSRETAAAVTEAWSNLDRAVLDTVDWPERAASWLKPARRLISCDPDAWVIVDNPAGCAQLAMRLLAHEGWAATRTFGTASLDSADIAALTPVGALEGMRGATADGGVWRIGRGVVLRD